uniref:Peptidase S1 domain-containing protein n=1 Tax=Anopheles arabiensis TaxID=7173 RepID=A0A2C9GPA8_ANOAR
MYYSVKQYLLLMGCLYLVTQIRGQDEDQLLCGRRKVQTNSMNNNGDAIAGHWPWYAAIYHRIGEKQEYACGGSILDETTILTASNCVYTPSGVISAALVTVHVGQIHPKQASAYAQTYGVREIVVHPGFSEASTVNDIALIKLTASITMTTEYVQPVCLWTMDSALELIVGRNGTVVGFGPNERRDAVSKEQLQQATIGVVDPQTCIASDPAVFGTHPPLETFCGKRRQNGVGTCNGNSGDGLFVEVSGRWFVRGLVARLQPVRGSDGLCDPLQYTVYTDVAKYVEWIKRYVDPRVLPVENGVLTMGVDYEEKLRRLFNFDSCGLTSSVALYGQHNLTLPWLGEVMVPPNADSVKCIVTLISDRYAVGPAHCFVGGTPYISLDGVVFNDYLECYSNGNESSTCTALKQKRKIQRVIVHPNFDKNNSTDNIALIELLSPANTSHPNVLPICMPVMPKLRTQAKTNLHVATAEMHGTIPKNVPVRYLEPDECTKVYAEEQIVLNLDLHKRLCAVIERWEDEEACKPLVAGAPLQETKQFRGKEQYVLRGFELAGLACRSSAPAIYHSIEPYVDWILYNMMRYNVVEETDVPDAEITPPTLESERNKLQQQSGSDKLHLFNLDTCGLFSLESNSQTGKEATFAPWIVSFDKVHKRSANVNEVISSTAVLTGFPTIYWWVPINFWWIPIFFSCVPTIFWSFPRIFWSNCIDIQSENTNKLWDRTNNL